MVGAYQKPLKGNRAQCLICPHECILEDGQTARCMMRKNKDGIIYAIHYMESVCCALDPIEKKPLRQFLPRCKVLSVGPNGCNMHCPFCQNHTISQEKHPSPLVMSFRALRDTAKSTKTRAPAMAYTFGEPFVWFETLRDLMPAMRRNKMKNVVVTNGFINPKPLLELLPHIDAMNIDIKTFDTELYKKFGGDRDHVIRTINLCKDKTHVELSYIMIPENVDPNRIRALCQYIEKVCGKSTPLHLLRFFPAYKMEGKPTPLYHMDEAYEIAREYLSHVYLENV